MAKKKTQKYPNKIKVANKIIKREKKSRKKAGKNKRTQKCKFTEKNILITNSINYKNKIYSMRKISEIIKNKYKQAKNDDKLTLICFNIFDIDNDINTNYFRKLQKADKKKYNNLIQRYKYTLNLDSSLELKCLTEKELKNELEYYNSKIILIEGNIIKDIKIIKSFSKLKFFNFLLDIIIDKNRYFMRNGPNFDRYKIEEDLLFKAPNSLGTTELYYYTLILLYYNFLSKNEESSEDIRKKENNIIDQFDRKEIQKIIGEKILFDDSNFVNNFNVFKKKYEEKIDINKFKYEESKKDYSIDKKIQLLRLYTKAIEQIVKFELSDDNYIIKKCEFILNTCLFDDVFQVKMIQDCLIEDKRIPNIIEQLPVGWNINELCFTNCTFSLQYNKNIFLNYSTRFKFPYILKRNSLMNSKKIFDCFIDYIKSIYKSSLMKEIFYNTPEFMDFLYPFDNDEILDELFDNIIFLPMKSNGNLYGHTQKLLGKIYVPANINITHISEKDFTIEKLINFFANLLITILHEQFKHYMKMLIYFNSFIYNKNIDLLGDNLEINDDNNKIFFSILSKNKNNNNKKYINLPKIIDGGNKLEILLFGDILGDIYVPASLDIFNASSWNLSISQHLERFEKINQKGIYCQKETLEIDKLEKNENVSKFLILLLKEYCNIKNINDRKIEVNNQYFSTRISYNNWKNFDDNNNIIIDTSYYDTIYRTKRDCDM